MARRKKRGSNTINLKIIVLVIFLLLAGGLYYAIPRYVKINSTTCKSQYGPCSKRVEEKLEEVKGQNLFDTKESLDDFLSKETMISDFNMHFKLPDRFEVNILTRKPVFALAYEEGNAAALIDKNGYVLSFQEKTSLPAVETENTPPDVGNKVPEKELFSLRLMSDLYEFYQVSEGKMEKDGLTIELGTGERVIFPLEGDRQVLIASLSVILSKLNNEADDTRIKNDDGDIVGSCAPGCTIDLRYKNPVIRN